MPVQTVSLDVEITGDGLPWADKVLTDEALELIRQLHHNFEVRRLDLLEQRRQQQRAFDDGETPDFLPETDEIRRARWSVAPSPLDLQSLSHPLIADLEDSLAPTWENVIGAHAHIRAAASRGAFRGYAVRPRGLHLVERHAVVMAQPVSAALFDFALYVSAARVLHAAGITPLLSLAKLESHLEARFWNDVLAHAERHAGMPSASLRVIVMIETVPAAFEMDEILYELRHRVVGLSAGLRDYTFSFLKKFRRNPALVLADHATIDWDTPFVAAMATLLRRTCSARGARAFGAAAIEPGSAPAAGRAAVAQEEGVAAAAYDVVARRDLLDPRVPGAAVTAAAAAHHIRTALRYLAAWLDGTAAIAIDNAMADVATAEVCRSQLWQWVQHDVPLQEGGTMSRATYRLLRERVLSDLHLDGTATGRLDAAAVVLDELVLSREFIPYITFAAYPA